MTNFAFLDNGSEPLLFAHRGGNAAGPEKENSMAAFQAAYDLGYQYFETDVILAASGEVMAIHGSKNALEARRTGLPPRKQLQAMTYAEISDEVRIGGEEIPLLEEILITFPDVRVNIDAKTPEVTRPLGKLIARRNDTDRVCIAAFSEERTSAVAEELGGRQRVCTAAGPAGFTALLKSNPKHLKAYLEQSGAACLQFGYRLMDLPVPSRSKRVLLTAERIAKARELGVPVHAWTVNNASDMKRALAEGAGGVMSDEIATLKSVAAARQQELVTGVADVSSDEITRLLNGTVSEE